MFGSGFGGVGGGRSLLTGAWGWFVALLAGVVLGVGASSAWAASSPTAYVANDLSGTVSVIDTATNTVVGGPITVGSDPARVAITPDGQHAYVTNNGSGTVSVIDTASNTVVGSPIAVGLGPRGVAITPDGEHAYVANSFGPGTVSVIDTSTNAVVGSPIAVGSGPTAVAITPDGKHAYVVNQFSGTVSVIDTATNTVVGSPITVGGDPFGVAITPDQGPVAAFSVTPAGAGQAWGFDASASSDPEGTVASYRWDFGDGTTQITSSPTTTHTYASPASYTVTLTVTNEDGCSTTGLVFTGQTVSCHGSPAAQTSRQLGPLVSVSAPSSGTAGSAISGSAVTAPLSGGFSPSGSIAFKVFGPQSSPPTSCSGGTTVASASVSGDGSYSPSSGFTLSAGDYWWYASYGGDSNNPAAASVCGAGMPETVVGLASPALSVAAPASGVVGSAISASSVVAALTAGFLPSGSVAFRVFGPQSTPPASCGSGGTTVGSAPVSGNGTYSPPAGFTPPSPGDYWWYASYGGDQNNNPAASTCGAGMTETIIGAAHPSLGVSAPSLATAGEAISPTSIVAALSGGASPTGTVTFTVFGPQSSPPSTCTSGGAMVGSTPVSGNGSYSPPAAFTPPAAGDYWVYASYNGDTDNNPASSACGAGMIATIVGDTSAPAIGLSLPGSKAVFSQGEIIDAHYACTDPGEPTDVATCTGTTPSGSPLPTRSLGAHTFTVNSTDKEGNSSSVTHTYTVVSGDGEGQITVSPQTVGAATAHHTLTFTYKAANGGIDHGQLTLRVPPGWSAPSTNPTAPGYVTASEGHVSITGNLITVQIPILASQHTLGITYGNQHHGGPGATSPTTTGKQAWPTQERSSPTGTLINLTNPAHVTIT